LLLKVFNKRLFTTETQRTQRELFVTFAAEKGGKCKKISLRQLKEIAACRVGRAHREDKYAILRKWWAQPTLRSFQLLTLNFELVTFNFVLF